MIKKALIALIVILTAATLVFATSGNTSQNNPTNPNINQSTDQQNQVNSSDNGGSISDTSNQVVTTSPQEIAQKYIKDPNASTGKPIISKINGNYYYAVPVKINKNTVGEIDIDPKTGKNVGGAGGAPE